MDRTALDYLKNWFKALDRKPLVIRGARQVGKTWLVRKLAKDSTRQLIEINFEKEPSHASLFESNNPKQILLNLGAVYNRKIDPKNSLLFLDEIQAIPQLFSKLRWFAEDLSELPVIAAGSLLDFVLADYSYSVPVGRITYMHLEPLSFEEFLLALNKKFLAEYIAAYDFNEEIPEAIHDELMRLLKEYLLVGGLPAVVDSWRKEYALEEVSRIQNDLLATYRNDFAKYKGRLLVENLDEIMLAIPQMLGQKFIYSRVNNRVPTAVIKQGLGLLEKARIGHKVLSCSANGIPLSAEIKEKYFKEVFLDTGLCCAALGLRLNQMTSAKDIILVNSGGVAEQIVGQMLRTINPFFIEPQLFYWLREEKGSSAEIDYVIQHGNQIIPIEVKAGSAGSLKSLHLFMNAKKLTTAVRINSNLPIKLPMKIKNPSGPDIQYELLSIPFYLVGQLHRLLDLV